MSSTFENIISAGDEVFERIVIVKDIGVLWKPKIYPVVSDPNEKAEVSLSLTPEESRRRSGAMVWREV